MALSAADQQQFQQLLAGLLSPVKDVRTQAEQAYVNTKQTAPEQLMAALMNVLATPGEEGVRHTASVYFWKNVRKLHAQETIWGKLSPQAQVGVKSQLLQVLGAESSGIIRRKLAEAAGEIGCQLCASEPDQWPELLPMLFGCTTAGSDARETAMRVLREMVHEDVVGQRLLSSFQQQTGALLQAGIVDAAPMTRCQTVLLILGFVENEVQQKQLMQMIPQIISVLQSFATPSTAQELNDTLQKLVEVVEEEAGWFRQQVPQIFETMLGIARAKDQLSDEARRLAFEFLVSFVEKKVKLCLKLPNMGQQLMSLSMEFMLEMEEECGWDEHMDEDDEEVANYDVGLENVDRMAKALECERACPIVFQLVGGYLSQSWKHKVVALMTLSQVAETVEEEDHVDQIVGLLIQSLTDEHPRVRYAGLHAIGQVSTDHQPYVQEKHGERLIQVLMQLMDDPHDRVKSHACAAFTNLGEEISQDTMLQFTQQLMGKVFPLVQSRSRQVREQAITAIAVVAGCIEEHFVPYYQHIVPLLKQVIVQCTSKEERNLRGKAFECISLIGMSVGKEVFKADAAEVMQAMMATQAAGLDADDPQKSFIEEAINRVCRSLKADFAPYLPQLLPICFRVISMKPEVLDVAVVEDDEESDQTIAFLEDGSCVGLKTSQLEDIQSHLNMIFCFVEVLGPDFFDCVPTTAEVLLHLLDFSLDNDIREVAIDTWAAMLKCVREGLAKRGNQDTSMVTSMLREFLKKIALVLAKEDDCEQLQTISVGVAEAIKAAPDNCLTAGEVQTVVDLVAKLLEESFTRRAEGKKKGEEEVDEDDVDELEEAAEAEGNARHRLCEIGGALMKTHKEAFVQVGLQKFSHLLQTLMGSTEAKEDQLLGLYIACDFLDHMGEQSVPVWGVFMQQLLDGLNHKNEDVRQACAYGASCASKIPSFGQYVVPAVTRIQNAIQDPKATKKKNKTCTENLVAALGNLCLHHGATVPMVEAQWKLWLGNLPITADYEEGLKVHKTLAQLVNAQHVPLLGANGENLGQAFAVLAEVYKSTSSDDEINAAIRQLMKGLGEARLASLVLNDKQKKKVQRVIRDCQKEAA